MIYVDELTPAFPKPTADWRYDEFCHMFADTPIELHTFAARLGLKRSWFQNSKLPHYDLTRNKREKAILLGAKAISTRMALLMFKNHA
jgi:hypothetical protein